MSDEPVNHKEELLRNLRREHTSLAELLDALTPAQMTTHGVHGDDGGDWTVRDVLSHLTWWEQSVFGWLDLPPAVPRSPIPEGDLTDDQINAAIFAGNNARELTEVLRSFEHSFQQLMRAVEEVSEERLNQPRTSDPGGTPIRELVSGNTYEHYHDHREAIRTWLSTQRGDTGEKS